MQEGQHEQQAQTQAHERPHERFHVHKQNYISHMWQNLLAAEKDDGAVFKKGELAQGILVGRSSDGWYQVLLVEVYPQPTGTRSCTHPPPLEPALPFPGFIQIRATQAGRVAQNRFVCHAGSVEGF